MIALRAAGERGLTRTGWLESRHGFSFGAYHDPAHMGFGPLRVLNDDIVAGGGGFAPHRHANMEILTWVLSGRLAHRDSSGGGGELGPGDLQHMSAGSGIEHSEFNASATEPVHFLQIWIQPDRLNAPPRHAQRTFPESARRGRLCLVASPDAAGDALRIAQDARMYVSLLESGDALDVPLDAGRRAYIQLARGRVLVGALDIAAGDAIAVSGESNLGLRATEATELLWFDLPGAGEYP
jgi:redox-sensitive bicupin YhaK (pirin superfamily)